MAGVWCQLFFVSGGFMWRQNASHCVGARVLHTNKHTPCTHTHTTLQVDPLKGNVAFAAPLYGWSFTLESFATLYCEVGAAVLLEGTANALLYWVLPGSGLRWSRLPAAAGCCQVPPPITFTCRRRTSDTSTVWTQRGLAPTQLL